MLRLVAMVAANQHITAVLLYNFLQCKHRVWRDIYGPQEEKSKETNPFVQLLWERGVLHEAEVVKGIGKFFDLRIGSLEERFKKTLEEMKKGTDLIYQGVLMNDDLVGIPDLLRKKDDGKYIPIDIKSGRGYEGVDESGEPESDKLKKHYAIQLCLYQELLQRLNFSKKQEGIIYDIDNKEVYYDLSKPMGIRNKKSWVEYHYEVKEEVNDLITNAKKNKPALGGKCKLCPWYSSCTKWVKKSHDLTLLFYVGEKDRNTINKDLNINKIEQIESLNIDQITKLKTVNKNYLKGIAEKKLQKIKQRANVLIKIKKPTIYNSLKLVKTSYELFFDIEDDPTQGFVYLHGVLQRSRNKLKYINFLAGELTKDSEKKAWQEFINYLSSLPKNNFSIYYYSPHEKSNYKRLQKQYPDVISEDAVLKIFESPNSIDLYSIIIKNTDWPLSSYSLKDIATYLGFKWRDKSPSGALSIEWFNKYLETCDESILNRIKEYNEDDCKATMIIKDYLEQHAPTIA